MTVRINNKVQIDNILKSDLHMHTTFCDGRDTPEEMVKSAISKGFTSIGFSGHSYVDFDPAAGMDEETQKAYRSEIHRLKEKYAGQITIYCGIELDYHTLPETGTREHASMLKYYKDNYDYIIGSVHYIEIDSFLTAVDDTPELLSAAVVKYLDGDFYQAAELYFGLAADVVRKTECDIIGHFDLISKFNQKNHFFDEQNLRYKRTWKEALDKLIPEGRVFEINTGAMSRSWKDTPYPAPEMIDYIYQQSGDSLRFVLSSDSHNHGRVNGDGSF